MEAPKLDSSAGVAPWIQTATGLAFDLLDPSPRSVDYRDIAMSLTRQARFLGHTTLALSVASHSLMVRDIALSVARASGICITRMRDLELAAVLHDAHEAYIGDVISPVMGIPGIRDILRPVKARIQAAIHQRFHLPVELPEDFRRIIHMADLTALATEKRDLMGECEREWMPLPEPCATCAGRQVSYGEFVHLLARLAFPGTPLAANEEAIFEATP